MYHTLDKVGIYKATEWKGMPSRNMNFALNFGRIEFIIEFIYMNFKAKRKDFKQIYAFSYFISNLDSLKVQVHSFQQRRVLRKLLEEFMYITVFSKC